MRTVMMALLLTSCAVVDEDGDLLETTTVEHPLECDDPGEHGDQENSRYCRDARWECDSRVRRHQDRCERIARQCRAEAHEFWENCFSWWDWWTGNRGAEGRCEARRRAKMELCNRDWANCHRQSRDIRQGCESRYDGECW